MKNDLLPSVRSLSFYEVVRNSVRYRELLSSVTVSEGTALIEKLTISVFICSRELEIKLLQKKRQIYRQSMRQRERVSEWRDVLEMVKMISFKCPDEEGRTGSKWSRFSVYAHSKWDCIWREQLGHSPYNTGLSSKQFYKL